MHAHATEVGYKICSNVCSSVCKVHMHRVQRYVRCHTIPKQYSFQPSTAEVAAETQHQCNTVCRSQQGDESDIRATANRPAVLLQTAQCKA